MCETRACRAGIGGRTLHYAAERIEHSFGGKVLGWYEIYEMFLPILLLHSERGELAEATRTVEDIDVPSR